MELKGANRSYTGAPQPDRWGIVPDHEVAAKRGKSIRTRT